MTQVHGDKVDAYRRGHSPWLPPPPPAARTRSVILRRRCELLARRSLTFVVAASFLCLSVTMSILALYQNQLAEDEVCMPKQRNSADNSTAIMPCTRSCVGRSKEGVVCVALSTTRVTNKAVSVQRLRQQHSHITLSVSNGETFRCGAESMRRGHIKAHSGGIPRKAPGTG